MAARNIRVSVVVPTCNRSERAVRLVEALAAQDLEEPFEVVFVDDLSRDDTLERLGAIASSQPFAMTVVPSQQNTGPAGARNRGWNIAQGELIAFTDDDCVPDKGWLSALVTGLEHADVAVGRTRPPAEQLHLIGPFSHYLDIDHNQSFSTCNIGYRRSVLQELDGFDSDAFNWPNGEDSDLGLRAVKAGYRDGYVADALVWHDVAPSSFAGHFHRIPRLDGLVALVARHPEARQNMQAGMFLRSVDKAVLIVWAAALGLLLRPRSTGTRLLGVIAVLLYVWQHDKTYFKARSIEEWAVAVPLGFVADSWAVMVMIRSSIRYKTLLL
jgi:glycosyltransferase involved in cell wall biosynthesis